LSIDNRNNGYKLQTELQNTSPYRVLHEIGFDIDRNKNAICKILSLLVDYKDSKFGTDASLCMSDIKDGWRNLKC